MIEHHHVLLPFLSGVLMLGQTQIVTNINLLWFSYLYLTFRFLWEVLSQMPWSINGPKNISLYFEGRISTFFWPFGNFENCFTLSDSRIIKFVDQWDTLYRFYSSHVSNIVLAGWLCVVFYSLRRSVDCPYTLLCTSKRIWYYLNIKASGSLILSAMCWAMCWYCKKGLLVDIT